MIKNKLELWIKMWAKGNSCSLLDGIHSGTATVEISMEVSQKSEKDQRCDPPIQFLGTDHGLHSMAEIIAHLQIQLPCSSVHNSKYTEQD